MSSWVIRYRIKAAKATKAPKLIHNILHLLSYKLDRLLSQPLPCLSDLSVDVGSDLQLKRIMVNPSQLGDQLNDPQLIHCLEANLTPDCLPVQKPSHIPWHI